MEAAVLLTLALIAAAVDSKALLNGTQARLASPATACSHTAISKLGCASGLASPLILVAVVVLAIDWQSRPAPHYPMARR